MPTRRLCLLLALLTPGLAPAAEAPALDACLDTQAAPGRVACLDAALGSRSLRERLAAATPLLEAHPDLLSEFLGHLRDSRTDAFDADPGLEAARLDLLGQALALLGRSSAAADALAAAAALDDGTLRLTWREADGGTRWSRPLDMGNGRIRRAVSALVAAGRPDDARPLLEFASEAGAGEWAREVSPAGPRPAGLDRPPVELSGVLWREGLPDLEVRLFGGRTSRLSDARGDVLLLDFWASWCAPCVRELPFLEEFYRERADRGLQVLAINYHEEPQEAIAFAQAMGLSIPVGLADRSIESAFKITSMPTLIVADRSGRLRGRWEGYEDNVEAQLTELVDQLLDTAEPDRIELGRVLQGEDALRADWVRVGRRDIESVQIVRTENGPRVAAAHSRVLTLFDVGGAEERSLTRPQAASRLHPADLDGDGADELIGFRPGSNGVFVFDLKAETFVRWESPQPVFDVEVVPVGDAGKPRVLLGTLHGLFGAEPDGSAVTPLGELGAVSGITSVRGAGDAPGSWSLTVLESGARLHWMDRDLAIRHSVAVQPEAWTLVAATGIPGAAAATISVVDTAAGSFLPGGGRQIALALDSGHLVLVDADTGAPRYRAALASPVTALAAGDLDGDGLDELALAAGRNLTLMRATRPGGGATANAAATETPR